MKPEEQIKAIAKVMGMPEIHQVVGRGWVYGVRDGGVAREYRVPNYLGSLDAMHDAENTLTIHQKDDYARILVSVHPDHYNYTSHFKVAHASAAQRAEAFLRVKGLWVEDEPKINPEWKNVPAKYDVIVASNPINPDAGISIQVKPHHYGPSHPGLDR